MTINQTTEGGNTVLSLSGWLDTQTAPDLEDAVDALDETAGALVFDFSELEYISSAGLRQLVAAHKKMGGNLTLRHVPGEIRNILKMAGFDKRLNIEE